MKSNRIPSKTFLQGGLITITVAIVLLTLGVSQANAQADLVETSVSNPPATTTEKAGFWVTDTVKNAGTVAAPPSVTQYYFSATGIKDSGSILLSGKRSVASLKPGQTSRGMTTVKVPLQTPIGQYYLLACANDTGSVQESNETNNCISSTKTVQLLDPDLVETLISDPPGSVSTGDSFPVTDTVQNHGNKSAPTSITRYYLSSNGVKDGSSILLIGQRSIPSLAPETTSQGTVTVGIPPGVPEGTYYLLACADDTNKIAEGNEQNNCTPSSGKTTTSPPNVLQVTVNGSLCSANSYLNKPCVKVTVCTPNTTTCQTIDDILLDTGSYGLRVFKQVLGNLSLPQEMVGSAALAECVQFADGSSDWGPVLMADVVLGNEPAVQVPIHVINAAFGIRPQPCHNADTGPSAAGFNGILGLGPFGPDCGPPCESNPQNGLYYACAGGICRETAVPRSSQVSNPVASLPFDNNGVIVKIPAVPAQGSISVDGQLLLGIGTQSNNIPPAGITSYPVDDNAEFQTIFNEQPLTGFLDTGSNGLFFPAQPDLPDCSLTHGSDYSGWFCPPSMVDLLATNQGFGGSPSGLVQFEIGNFYSLINDNLSNNVFPDIGGDIGLGVQVFDWGMPFHEGRDVYVGIENMSSTLGTGPYWAY